MTTSTIEPELNSLLAKLSVEIKNDTEQVEILNKRITKNEKLLHAVKGSLGITGDYGGKSETVWRAIEALQKLRFTQDDVQAELRRANPQMEINRNRIRAVLWKFAVKDKKLNLARKGTKQQPAEFERIEGIEGIVRYRRNGSPSTETKPLSETFSSLVTLENIRQFLTKHNARRANLAKYFGVSKEKIEELINGADSGIELHGKGWLKLKQ